MTSNLTATAAVVLISWYKPLLMVVALVGWGWVVSHLDKDAEYYFLPRHWWNLTQMGCAIVAIGLMLWIPIFPIGLMVGLLLLVGGIFSYAYYRNTKVPERYKWSFSLDSFTGKIDQLQHAQAQKHAMLTLLAEDESRIDVPSGDNPNTKAHAVLEQVIDFAVPRGADRIDLLVEPKQAIMTVRIDGVKYPQDSLELQNALVLIDYLKTAAGLDIEDRRKKQTGVVRFDAGELGRHTLEIETAGSTRGLTMSTQIDASRRVRMPLTHLGLLESQKKSIRLLLEIPEKVVIAAAPPRLGTTTTLYSLVQEHDPYTSSVVTLEDESSHELEGVDHHLVPEGTTAEKVNELLGGIIRGDPNVVMLSRLYDDKTASMIARAAPEMRFYLGMRQDDTFSALRRWVKAVGDRRLAAHGLGAILCQRMVRKLCTTCRTPYTPDSASVRKLNLPADRVGQFYHASGHVIVKDKTQPCPVCLGIGYRGRIGVFELMLLDPEGRQFVAAGQYDRLRSHQRKQKMLWLQEAGLARVLEGITDIKEVTRALGERTGHRKHAGEEKVAK